MDHLVIFLTALGLAMDCLAVSLSCGIVMQDFGRRDALRLGVFFGGFQGGMTVLGWAGGLTFAGYIEAVDHWFAFVLLAMIGAKMMFEGFQDKQECSNLDIRKLKVLVILSVATSIDALAVGISYALIDVNIAWSSFVIGLASFCLAWVGGTFGSRLGERFGKRMEIVGGVILIGLGLKILLEHTVL